VSKGLNVLQVEEINLSSTESSFKGTYWEEKGPTGEESGQLAGGVTGSGDTKGTLSAGEKTHFSRLAKADSKGGQKKGKKTPLCSRKQYRKGPHQGHQ